MRSARVIATVVAVLFVMSIGSVFAAGYSTIQPLIGTIGSAGISAPPAGGSPPLVAGTLQFIYSDGSPVILSTNTLPLKVCTTSSCVSIDASISNLGNGKYSYSFEQPALSGPVTM